MKVNENLQVNAGHDHADAKKATKLSPSKKSGKRPAYNDLDEEEDYELSSYKKRESILDYYDDVEDEEDEDQEYDEDEEEYDDDEEEYDDEDNDE